MVEQDPRITNVKSYTEATHTAYADVTGFEPMTAGTRLFVPSKVTLKYHWRTQLGHYGWSFGNIEISGPWLSEAMNPQGSTGTGRVILNDRGAPDWARAFATANLPTSSLVDWTTQ